MFWENLKISIAGAKLSHLVQKDKIWDHGSMVEQVRTVFLQLQKALLHDTDNILRKYMTVSGYRKLKDKIDQDRRKTGRLLTTDLLAVAIVCVYPGSKEKPARFKALLKERTRITDVLLSESPSPDQRDRMALWVFVRQGDWWLLDEIKN